MGAREGPELDIWLTTAPNTAQASHPDPAISISSVLQKLNRKKNAIIFARDLCLLLRVEYEQRLFGAHDAVHQRYPQSVRLINQPLTNHEELL
jgi:hypothetical protein